MLKNLKQQLKERREVYIRIKVKPNARQSIVKQVMADESVKLDIAAPPLKNKANQELIKLLAREFEISPNNVTIISGGREKIKLVKITN
jgi:uncharacterized protein